ASADLPDVVVVKKDVVLDEAGVGGAVVGKEQAGHVVLDDVVEDLRAVDTGREHDAGADVRVLAGLALNRKAVERDVVGGDFHRIRDRSIPADDARPDGFTNARAPKIAARVHARLCALERQRFADDDLLADVPRVHGHGAAYGTRIHGRLNR